MSKKKIVIIIFASIIACLVSVLLIITILFCYFCYSEKFDIQGLKDCSVSYYDQETDSIQFVEVSVEDEKKILEIFDKAKLYGAYGEYYACPFGKEAALYFNNQSISIYIAQDSCQGLYLVNENKYMTLDSSKDYDALINILKKYKLLLRYSSK